MENPTSTLAGTKGRACYDKHALAIKGATKKRFAFSPAPLSDCKFFSGQIQIPKSCCKPAMQSSSIAGFFQKESAERGKMVGVAVPGEGIRRFRRASELTRERQAGAAWKTRREKGISSQAKKAACSSIMESASRFYACMKLAKIIALSGSVKQGMKSRRILQTLLLRTSQSFLGSWGPKMAWHHAIIHPPHGLNSVIHP